jgi:hypothetical protein
MNHYKTLLQVNKQRIGAAQTRIVLAGYAELIQRYLDILQQLIAKILYEQK